jgi:ATP-dependent helicase/nuclease subunit B
MAEQPFLPFDEPEERPAAAAPSGARLIDSLARVCRERPLDEKVLVAPSLFVGHTLVERLAREGHSWVNLRVETARTIALAVAGPAIAAEKRRLLSRAQALALVEQACGETLTPKSYFGELRDRPGFHRALQRTFDEIRAAGLSAAALPAKAFDDARKLRELKAVLARYDADLEKGHFVDSAAVLRRAAAAAAPDPAGAFYLVVDEAALSAVEKTLLEKVAAGRLEILAAEPAESWKERARGARLLRASGEENEIREVFRQILS